MARNFGTAGPKGTGNGAGVGETEDLAKWISLISREDTPFMSSIGKTKASAIYHEWQIDELASPSSQAASEGINYQDATNAQANTPFRSRVGNYVQLNSKVLSVSGTKLAVNQAGVANEYSYQLDKRGKEMRRDQEFDFVHANSSSNAGGAVNTGATLATGYTQPTNAGLVGSSGVTPRTFGGFQAFNNYAGVTTGTQVFTVSGPSNVVGPNGELPTSAGVLTVGAGTCWTAPATQGNGTAGAVNVVTANRGSLQLQAVDVVMQSIYQNGGSAKTVMLSPANRKAFSARSQAASTNTRRNIDESGKLRQSVEYYMSDFGDIQVVPNYIMGLDSSATSTLNVKDFFGLVYDPAFSKVAVLRPMKELDLGQVGDSQSGQIVEDITYECTNGKAGGMIVGLNGS